MKFVAPASARLLPFADWQALDEDERLRAEGVVLPNDIDIETLESELRYFSVIALPFPKWTDGRAYSQARLLRARYQYAGEIRAVGEVVADMLPLLARTGFNAVQLRADQDIEVARRALGHFSEHYQGDVRQPQPRFARGWQVS